MEQLFRQNAEWETIHWYGTMFGTTLGKREEWQRAIVPGFVVDFAMGSILTKERVILLLRRLFSKKRVLFLCFAVIFLAIVKVGAQPIEILYWRNWSGGAQFETEEKMINEFNPYRPRNEFGETLCTMIVLSQGGFPNEVTPVF